MNMIVSHFIERCSTTEKEPNGWFKVLKGQYEMKGYPMTMGRWESEAAFVRERAKGDHKYKGVKTVEADGKQYTGHYFDQGSTYGIHSFILISFE